MKHNFFKNFIISAAVISITALPAFCAPTVKDTAIKFLFAMLGVVVSSLIIFFGLTFYNKLFKNENNYSEPEESLTTPNNIEDAVVLFIKKNKLK